ncbi:MAG: hypothetical protein IT450_21345 [Phycisphaerales bacterium]|nr:hypothetical protein [Phycisphaerales bacterium]
MLLGSMLSWADTVLVRVLSGLGLLLLTAAQPKALTWHHAEPGESDTAAGNPLAGGHGPAAPAPHTPDGKKKREPLTLAATLPQTMSPRSPVCTVSEAERQAGDGKPRNTFGDASDSDSIAAAIAGALRTAPPAGLVATTADSRPAAVNPARRLLCLISPIGPPRA